VLEALNDPDETVRHVALHSVSVRRDRSDLPAVLPLLKSPSPQTSRAAAEAIGRIGDTSAVPALLAALQQPADRALEHSLTFALIEIADAAATAAGLQSDNPRVRRAALTALDQMAGGKLPAAAVVKELTAADPALKETAWWIAGRHPEWGESLTSVLLDRLGAKDLPPAEQDELARQLARFAKAAPAQQLLVDLLNNPATARDARRIVLRAMAQASLRESPSPWVAAVTAALSGDDVELTREAVAVARSLRFPPKQRPEALIAALLNVGGDAKAPAAVRLNALAAVPGGLAKLDRAALDFLLAQLAPEQPVPVRSAAADVLSKAKLPPDQLVALAGAVKAAGPLEVDRLIDAFAQSTDETVGLSLVAALAESPGRSALRSEALKPRLAKFGPAVQKQAQGLYAALDQDTAQQRQKLETLLAALKDGEVRRGQAVFHSPKAACASCHALGYLGGRVGPDLTHIGRIRTDRDLLEAIAFPSASFVRSYEPVQVVTRSGKVHNGLPRQDTPDEVVLTTGADQEVRVPREDIEEVQPGAVSVMPSGLDQQLSPQELADLIAFLRACK
jgi:putative heme-binding domain-containing protein